MLPQLCRRKSRKYNDLILDSNGSYVRTETKLEFKQFHVNVRGLEIFLKECFSLLHGE